jgi:hypothetical protein
MLHKGMAVICRTEDELKVLANMVNKTDYKWVDGKLFSANNRTHAPVRISFNSTNTGNHCITKCDDLGYPLNTGITEVVEASDLFKNQLISLRRAKP